MGPDDLDEAEAVDRSPLERLRQMLVNCLTGFLTCRFASAGRKVDPDRASDVEAPDRLPDFLGPADGELLRRKRAVDVDQSHRRCWGNSQLATNKADNAAARFLQHIVPSGLGKTILRCR